MIKRLTNFDQLFFGCDNKVQIVLRIKQEKDIPKVIEKIKKILLPTRMRLEDNKYMLIGEDVPVASLPENINDLEEASKWITTNLAPDPKNSLGMVAANKNLVAMNVTHSACDGGFAVNMVNLIASDADVPEVNSLENVFDVFTKEIEEATAFPEDTMVHKGITRFNPRDKYFTTQNGITHYEKAQTPAKLLKCYDHAAGKPRGLTDALYANACLTCAAYDGKLDKIGLHTCVDLRKFVKGKWGLEKGNLFSVIDIVAENVTLDTTIREVMRKTRNYFNQRIKDNAQFGYFKHLNDKFDPSQIIYKARPSMSNLGLFKLGGPISDVFIKDSLIAPPDEYPRSDFIHYGIIDKDRNDCVTLFEYNQNQFSPREAKLLVNSVHYGLRNIELDDSCGKAIEKLTEFQKNYIKNEYPKYEYHIQN